MRQWTIQTSSLNTPALLSLNLKLPENSSGNPLQPAASARYHVESFPIFNSVFKPYYINRDLKQSCFRRAGSVFIYPNHPIAALYKAG